ncbi:MAG: riboflavin biosynthesis protein RibF [Gammaproteobacteria bacterium]|nr:MAG: riboflavin biosynthesis protein RibF [Gammaproteobacteria bacterium]
MNITFLQQLSVNSEDASNFNDIEGFVLTIGNFDGLHLGHQAMLKQTIELAAAKNLTTAVMVFEPMPREYFSPKTAPARLMNLAETKFVFSHFYHMDKGIDQLFVVDFDEKFRSLSAYDFAQILKEKLNVKAVVLGDDFRFGYDRTGDSEFLKQYGFFVESLNTVKDTKQNHERISSTRIRKLLAKGDLNKASELLGRDYTMIGEVQHGNKIGRTLDFPTANIALNRIQPALHGVFAVDVQILDELGNVVENGWQQLSENAINKQQIGIKGLAPDSLFGTANIGIRPAVNGLVDKLEWRLEVHFPEFKADLYGKMLKVRFLHYLHGEKKYDGLDALKAGIKQDVIDLLAWREKQ